MPSFDDAIAFFAEELDSEPATLAGGKAVLFALPADSDPDDVLDLQDEAKARGAYLFIAEPPMEDEDWAVGLAAAADQFGAIEVIGTVGPGGKPSTAEIVAWLRETHAKDPLVVDTLTEDAIGVSFDDPVKNPRALANRLYSFCPAIYEGLSAQLEDDPSVAEELGFPEGVPWHDPIEVLAATLKAEQALFLCWT